MLSKLQENAVSQLIIKVGEYIRNERKAFSKDVVEVKKLHDLVSYVDETSEQKLVNGLTEILPEAGVLAEEGTGESTRNHNIRWIIDPLDGTTNYVHDLSRYCISVALQVDGEVKYGWVYEIYHDEMFHAIKQGGAYLNGELLQVSKQTTPTHSLIATGFPVNKFERLEGYMKLLEQVIVNTRGVRRMGTAAYDLCLVASGRVEGYYEYGLNAWDVAAGSLIVEEAGGTVSDFSGNSDYLFGEEILASNSYIHEAMLTMVKETMHD